VTTATCNRTTAAQWLGLSILRVILTLLLIASYLYVSSAYNSTRRPSQSSQHRKHRRHRTRSDQSVHMSPPPTSASSQLPLNPGHPSRHPSRSTVASQGNTRPTPDRSLRTSHTSSTEFYPSSSSDEDENALDLRFDPVLMQQRLDNAIPPSTTTSSNTQSDRELNNFADRFRSLVSQISRETDDAVQIAQSDTYYDPVPLEDVYNTASYASYNNDYRYPPDDHIHILNGVVRRMPTIESLGSRELVSSIASSSQDRDRDRFGSLSRPPTRSVTESG
jgi:hypothetical protein